MLNARRGKTLRVSWVLRRDAVAALARMRLQAADRSRSGPRVRGRAALPGACAVDPRDAIHALRSAEAVPVTSRRALNRVDRRIRSRAIRDRSVHRRFAPATSHEHDDTEHDAPLPRPHAPDVSPRLLSPPLLSFFEFSYLVIDPDPCRTLLDRSHCQPTSWLTQSAFFSAALYFSFSWPTPNSADRAPPDPSPPTKGIGVGRGMVGMGWARRRRRRATPRQHAVHGRAGVTRPAHPPP